jgi:hypothetical protein
VKRADATITPWGERLGSAGCSLFLSVLLFAFVGVIFEGSIEDSPVLGWALRIFGGGVLGSLAFYFVFVAVRSVRGHSKPGDVEPSPPLPAVLALCPACGANANDAAVFCATCGHSLAEREQHWKGDDAGGRLGAAIGMAFGLGIVALAVIMGAGLFDGESSVWSIASKVGVIFLVGGFGVVFVYGSLRALFESAQGQIQYRYLRSTSGPGFVETVEAKARASRGRILSAEGTVVRRSSLDLQASKGELGRLSESRRAFVDLIAALFVSGFLDLEDVAISQWNALAEERPARSTSRHVMTMFRNIRVTPDFHEAMSLLSPLVTKPMALSELCSLLEKQGHMDKLPRGPFRSGAPEEILDRLRARLARELEARVLN